MGAGLLLEALEALEVFGCLAKQAANTGCPMKLDTPIFFLSVYYWIPPHFSKCLLLDTPRIF